MRRMLLWFVVLTLLSSEAFAAKVIPVVKPSGSGKVNIELSGLNESGAAANVFRKTLEGDLNQSGWFTLVAKGQGGILVNGNCVDSDGRLAVKCEVKGGGRNYLGRTYGDESGNARKLAHKVADDIVFAVKGIKGVASTRIALIGKVGGKKDLYLCDADGGGLTRITKDNAICLALNWAPDGNSLVYTSYAGNYPDVYMVNLATYKRRKIMQYPGLNMGADVSPDGSRIAVVLSKDGNPELYATDINGGNPVRLTRTPTVAEASPSWSPDGSQIVYVSNRSGLPHLFIISSSGGQPKRITFRGNENVAPDWGPKGIVYSSKREGRFQVCICDPASGKEVQQCTSDGSDNEDPSWAPDGMHVVFSKTAGYHSDLYVLDTTSQTSLRLTTISGDWSSPAWSPK